MDLLSPRDFYREAHARIYQAMVDLYNRHEPVDLVSVNALLKERGHLEGVGGPVFLAGLSEQVGFAANADYYARLVHDKAVLRRLLDCSQEIAGACLAPVENIGDFLLYVKSKIFDVISSNGSKRSSDLNKIIVSAQDFVKLEFPPKKTILFPWVKEYQVVMIFGPRGVGKSMFSLSLLAAIVNGKSFGPWKVENPVNCLYLDGEMPPQDTIERLEYLSEHDTDKKLFIYNDAHATSLGMPAANLLNEDWRKAMNDLLLKYDIKIWAVDNIASLAPGIDENSKQDWDPINKWFLELRAAGITTIFLHHANKEGSQRGTSGREDNIDLSVALDWPKNYQKEDGARFRVKFEKARIRHRDLHLLADSEFWLQPDQEGHPVWTWGSLKKQAKVEVIRMLDEGLSAKDVAAGLGISAARVSQIRRGAVSEGLITSAGKLTQTGFLWLQKT